MQGNLAEKLDLGDERTEGQMTKAIERQTAKLPSGFFLSLTIGSIVAALGLRASGKSHAANFIGLWVPSILLLGIYKKIVKVEGSERRS